MLEASSATVVTFLSDYGLTDEFVGVCHAVIYAAAPHCKVLDLTHGIAQFDVLAGAITLQRSLGYAPPGVHLAIVDPGVGGSRHAIAIRTFDEDRVLVGPDNGLLWLAAQRFGGVKQAVDISHSPHRLQPVSATFHGRDIFAPVAGKLAAGLDLLDVGVSISPDEITPLQMPMALLDLDGVVAHALAFDTFGNVMLDLEHEELSAGVGMRLGEPVVINGHRGVYATTFADVDEGTMIVYEDANRAMAVAINRGSARERLGLSIGDSVRIDKARR